MRAPKDSLEDFINKTAARKSAPPPAWKSVDLTGEVELVKPLATSYHFAERKMPRTSLLHGFYGLSWFHRSLIVGGSLTVVALVIWTSALLGVRRPPAEPPVNFADTFVTSGDVAANEQPEQFTTPLEEQTSSDLSPESSSPFAFREARHARSVAHFRTAARRSKPRLLLAAYRPHRFTVLPQFMVSSFVPTTLVIYVENGLVKTRIEPWLTASYKPSLPN